MKEAMKKRFVIKWSCCNCRKTFVLYKKQWNRCVFCNSKDIGPCAILTPTDGKMLCSAEEIYKVYNGK